MLHHMSLISKKYHIQSQAVYLQKSSKESESMRTRFVGELLSKDTGKSLVGDGCACIEPLT